MAQETAVEAVVAVTEEVIVDITEAGETVEVADMDVEVLRLTTEVDPAEITVHDPVLIPLVSSFLYYL